MNKLYCHEFSAPCDVVVFQCKYFDIDIQFIEIDFSNLEALPKTEFPPRVPILEDIDGGALAESRAIFNRLENINQKYEYDHYIDAWGSFIESQIIPNVDRNLWSYISGNGKASHIWSVVSDIRRDFDAIEKRLETFDYISGQNPRYPDFLLLSRIFYYYILDPSFKGLPLLGKWVERMITKSQNAEFFRDIKHGYLEMVSKLNRDNIPRG